MRAMKDSGIEWIGQIPQAWSVGKTIFGLEMPITDGPHETPQLYSEGIPFVSAEAVSTGNGRINFENIRGYISQEYYEECCKKYIPQREDIYMIKSGATTGKIAIVDTDDVFTIWSPLAVFRCNKERCISRFLFYTLQSDYYQKQLESKWSFGTQQNIGMRTLERLLICYPAVPEQERIVDYLDAKCAAIDALIAAKEKTNALLKERRQSIIYEAITKGLNPDAPMKDSGIEWIGQIPEHWTVKKIKYLGTFRNGLTYSPDNVTNEESGTLVLRSSNIQNGNVVFDDNVYVDMDIPKILQVAAGDILICSRNGSRELIGKNAIIPENVKASFGAFMMIFRCGDPKYLYYILNSNVFSYYLGTFLTSTVNQLTAANFGNMKVVYCDSAEEREEIVAHLDQKCEELDAAISTNEATIQKLKEYRQSIIYEAVTGKIEV